MSPIDVIEFRLDPQVDSLFSFIGCLILNCGLKKMTIFNYKLKKRSNF
jgi:hypothetical protein